MAIHLIPKAPGEVVDYIWTPPIDAGDSITGSPTIVKTSGSANLASFTVESGAGSVKLWFNQGTDGETSRFDATVVTAGGRTWKETFFLPVLASDKFSLTLALVKQHLEYEDSDRDDLIRQYMRAAASYVENHTGKALSVRQFTQDYESFATYLEIFKGPLVSVDSIDYIDVNDAPQTVTGYRTRGSKIFYPDGGWPSIASYSVVTVTYTAGYLEVPADLISAQLLLIAHWFENREAATERPAQAVEFAVESLCRAYREVYL